MSETPPIPADDEWTSDSTELDEALRALRRPLPSRFVEVAAGISEWTSEEAAQLAESAELRRHFMHTKEAIDTLRRRHASAEEIEQGPVEEIDSDASCEMLLALAQEQCSEVCVSMAGISVHVFSYQNRTDQSVVRCDEGHHQLLQSLCRKLTLTFDEFGYGIVPLPVNDVVRILEEVANSVPPARHTDTGH